MIFEVGDKIRIHKDFYCMDCVGTIRTIEKIEGDGTILLKGKYHNDIRPSNIKHISLVSKAKVTNWREKILEE